jgi:hypothetical protein
MKAPPQPSQLGVMASMAAQPRGIAQQMQTAPQNQAIRSAAAGYSVPQTFQSHIEQLGKLTRFFVPFPLLFNRTLAS